MVSGENLAFADPVTPLQTEMLVTRDGGILQLRNYAVATIPSIAFTQATWVKLLATSDKDTDSEYRSSMVFFDSFRRLPYEIRLRVGATPPGVAITLTVPVPKEFIDQTPNNHQIMAWVQVDQGDMDHFEVAAYTFSDKDSTVVIQLPVWAFTNKRPTSNREFEAIVIVGTVASSSGLDEKDRKIELLSQELARERKKIQELTAELNALRPPSAGEAVSVTEIVAVPEKYLDKELVLEGLWLEGNFTFLNPIDFFTLRAKDNNATVYCSFDKIKFDLDSRRILVAKLPLQTVRVRGYLRDAAKSTGGKTPGRGHPARFFFDVIKVEN